MTLLAHKIKVKDGKCSAAFKVKGKQIHKHYIDGNSYKSIKEYIYFLYDEKGGLFKIVPF